MTIANRSTQQLPTIANDTSWWRSLEELADTEEFRASLQREFPVGASTFVESNRREFLQLMSASLLLAAAVGCNIRQPTEHIYPAAKQTTGSPPGVASYYATAMDFAGSALGLVVEVRDGRPIKIEGNSVHPASCGATTIFAQAATLQLYDPDRMRAPKYKQDLVSAERLSSQLAALRQRFDQSDGQGLRILIGNSSSPTLQRLLDSVVRRWPKSSWSVFEPTHDDDARAGMMAAFGERHAQAVPVYHLDRAHVVLSLECDVLAARDMPPAYIRQFADARRVQGMEGSDDWRDRSRLQLFYLGPTPTITSAKADHKLHVSPTECARIIRQIAGRLGVSPQVDDAGKSDTQSLAAPVERWINKVVAQLQHAGPRALVIVGREQTPEMHALAHGLNATLGAIDQTVTFIQSPQVRPAGQSSDSAMLSNLIRECAAGSVDSLLLLGTNPVFQAPRDLRIEQAFGRVNTTLALADYEDETASRCDWRVPRAHFLESWGDARAFDGTASIVQPTLQPLHQSYSEIELLANLLDLGSGYEAVRATWSDTLGSDEDDQRWRSALAEGIVANSVQESLRTSRAAHATLDSSNSSMPGTSPATASDSAANSVADETFEWVIRPDATLWDGRFANNGWLQELPKPLTHVVWDNPAWMAPADAARLNLSNGDMIAVSDEDDTRRSIELPVWIVPGHATGCLTLFRGYGQRSFGRVGSKTGFDVGGLLRADGQTTGRAAIRRTGTSVRVVTTQHHQLMEGRHLVRSGTIDDYLKQPDAPPFAHPPSAAPAPAPAAATNIAANNIAANSDASFYPEWPSGDHKWGMTIDLSACVGCSACVIACQSENNIPVVGKQQCDRNRQMHWIRVDTYYQGPPEQPTRTLQQPVPCMHCELAPCEVVCPVAATNHSSEGLNQMIYNRCVGTRYCSNNCPYKVRRFNYLDYSNSFLHDSTLELLSNPEVTIRSRGVMEKCTYCVQRIERARITAIGEGRAIQEGEIQTACQSACPAAAIRFGDLNDPQSAVSQANAHPLSYSLLDELNTRPRTRYLAEVTNP